MQISRSIGDAYLKKFEFNRSPLLPRFRQSESFDKPILKAEPDIKVQKLTPEDQFLIFASDGLWELISDQEAVDMVKRSPRNVSVSKKMFRHCCFILSGFLVSVYQLRKYYTNVTLAEVARWVGLVMVTCL